VYSIKIGRLFMQEAARDANDTAEGASDFARATCRRFQCIVIEIRLSPASQTFN
jgi:hypothetical protein